MGKLHRVGVIYFVPLQSQNLFILNTDALFKPVTEKSGCDSNNTKSTVAGSSGIIEEMKATPTSILFSADITMAGLTFSFDRSVNGKGTKTISPRF